MPADWAAQRIKNLDLRKAVINAILPKRKQTEITTLIEEFQYPKYGPGMMWEVCAEKVEAAGGTVRLSSPVTAIKVADGRARSVVYLRRDGRRPTARHKWRRPRDLDHAHARTGAHHQPPPPAEVLAAADGLHYRDYLTVALVVPESRSFPDNWIYIHAPEVEVGRIQNYGSWSPYLVKDGHTCLGLEYFVFEGDEMWEMADDELIALATKELGVLGLVEPGDVEAGYVVRVPKAYPYYDFSYKANVETIRRYLEAEAPNVHPVGRNGMHKYNNQDHSMYTAMLTVENIYGAAHDIWAVNVEEEYHEGGSRGRTGRDAPILPPRPAFRRCVLGPGRDPSARWALGCSGRGVLPLVGFALWAHAWADGPGTHTLCGCGDPALFLWFFQSPATSLAHLQNPFYPRRCSTPPDEPAGPDLCAGPHRAVDPVTWLFGPVASFNVASTIVPALTALAMFVVLSRWVRWLPAAYLGGLLYGFSPFVLASLEYGHLMTAALLLLPLILAVLDEILVRQRHSVRRAGVALGLLVFAQFFLSTELLVVVVMLTVVSVAVLVVTAYVVDRERLRMLAPHAGVALGVGAAVGGGAPGLPHPLRPDRPRASVRCLLARHRHARRRHPLVAGRPRP